MGATKDKVVRNPDGSFRITANIAFDEFGPPFGYKELVAVPTFDERDMLPGEAQPSPVGSPGEYEVTFIFTRPELSLTEIRESDLDFLNGDSALVIAPPEPRGKDQPSGLRLDVSYLNSNRETKQCAITFRPNKHGRVSIAVTRLTAASYRDARDNAYRAFLPFLSKISFEHNIPLEIKASVTREATTGGKNLEFRSPFPFERFRSFSQGLICTDILALLSFYREGMNSTSISYSFLCFYRILEAIYKRRKETIERKRVRFSFKRENRLTEADLMGLSKRMHAYREFVGKKFRSIYENNLTPLRISIAHGLLGEENPFENTPDDISIRNRAGYLIPIAQILARLEIQNELTRDELPIKSRDVDTESSSDSDS